MGEDPFFPGHSKEPLSFYFRIFFIGRLEPAWDVNATEIAKEKRDSFERNTGTLASYTNSLFLAICFSIKDERECYISFPYNGDG